MLKQYKEELFQTVLERIEQAEAYWRDKYKDKWKNLYRRYQSRPKNPQKVGSNRPLYRISL